MIKNIKPKVKASNDVVNTIFSDDGIPKEGLHYIFIAAMYVDSVMKQIKKLSLSLPRRMQI